MHNRLFRDITQEELEEMRQLRCIRERDYPKGSTIFRSGEQVREIGLVQRGRILVERIDPWGNCSILNDIPAGEIFAEAYALSGEVMMVDAVAAEDTQVLFLHLPILTRQDNDRYSWYVKLLRNLLILSSRKNIALSGRIFCTSPKTIRGRLMTYFSEQSVRSGNREFDITFNRQELADYLSLDRSALSKELSKMRDEGLLDYRKNHFVLYQLEE